MERQNLFGSIVEIDEANTRRQYTDAEEWSCDCGDCRNFLVLARERHLPAFVLEQLDKLGIRPEKATYVCQMYPDGNGQHYQFSYRIAGNILSGEAMGEAGRCCHEPYPYGAPGFPEPHFDMEFWVTLPWVLDEPRKQVRNLNYTNIACESQSEWKSRITEKLKSATRFEIHCWDDDGTELNDGYE